MKKLLVLTGGGDCPGLNAVIRAVSKAARRHGGWKVWGAIEAFNGVLRNPPEIIKLTRRAVAGIHVKGGTILKTTNAGNPLAFPVLGEDGKWTTVDRSQELADRLADLGFDAVINIGGDGSQKISLALAKKGVKIVGVPKTIDNDLSATDLTFGFSTAVQTATESFDRLVTTAASHHRIMIMEVMGRDAGWIALHTAIAGGAEICLIPEIPYDINVLIKRLAKRYHKGKGFANIVIAEGAKQLGGTIVGKKAKDIRDEHVKLGGIGNVLRRQLEENGCEAQIRTTILGHTQRGGTPVAQDRVLASAMGIKAFDLVEAGQWGRMVSFQNNNFVSVPLSEAVKDYKHVQLDHYLIHAARNLGISFGDT